MRWESDMRGQLKSLSEQAADPELDAASAQVISACGGDAHSAVRALIVALRFAEDRLEQLTASVSRAYARDLFYRRLERAEPRARDESDAL